MTDHTMKETEENRMGKAPSSSPHVLHRISPAITYRGRGQFQMPDLLLEHVEDAGSTTNSINIEATKDLEAFLAEHGQPPLAPSEVFGARKRQRMTPDSEDGLEEDEWENDEEDGGKNKRVKMEAGDDYAAGDIVTSTVNGHH